MVDPHRVPAYLVEAAAGGAANQDLTALLFEGQRSRRRIQLLRVMDALDHRPDQADPESVPHALGLIEVLMATAAAVLDSRLTDPQTGMWLHAVLGRLRQGGVAAAGGPELARGLTALAVSTAMAAGRPMSGRVAVAGGWVRLPGRGSFRCPVPAPDGTVVVRTGRSLQCLPATVTSAGDAQAATTDAPAVTVLPQHWRPPTVLRARAGSLPAQLRLDDDWPYRDTVAPDPASALTGDEVQRWRTMFGRAWDLVVTHRRSSAEDMAGGFLRSLVPLAPGTGRRSATSSDAVGNLSATAPLDPVDLAVTLIHEVEHSKLWALMNLVDLCHRDRPPLVSPWRRDPRPAAGVLHGVSAFLAVAEFWASMARTTDHPQAADQVVLGQTNLYRAITTLLEADAVTAPGAIFVTGLRRRVDALTR